ncbi:MAG: class I SAM-dependent methyltransferase [Allosphingosinicella sp.]|uniref:class I SAM-dependent methyltransferase n=1 Tax=Allosphingosinicella sp. TaxID=2823234 RepID=UPI003954321D
MFNRSFMRAVLVGAFVALLGLAGYWIYESTRPPEPQAVPEYDPATLAGQRPDLDVPFVSTEYDIVRAMLDLAGTNGDDFVIDLGSGDGRIPIIAARDKGARGLGVDLDPARIRESTANALRAGVADRVTFRQQDLFVTPLADATVLTLYLLPEINMQLRPRILGEMRPGARVVSNTFDMGDWQSDARRTVQNTNIFLWIIPARVEGRWQLRTADGEATLTLRQQFQQVSGTAAANGRSVPLGSVQLRGPQIAFTVDLGGAPRRFVGRVDGASMAGEGWQATRIGN